MATTRHAPGTPSWIDLGTRDIEATVGFYGAVFGWTFLSLGARAGGYGFFQLNGRTVAAAGPLVRENDVPAWTVYFGVTDADATAGSVERAGGVVRFSPMDVFDNGRMAGFTDPQGAAFAIWQPRKVQGLDVVGCPGALLWVELHTSDPAAARAFYGSLFGWRYHETPVENFTYTRVSPTGDEKDAFGGDHTGGVGRAAAVLAALFPGHRRRRGGDGGRAGGRQCDHAGRGGEGGGPDGHARRPARSALLGHDPRLVTRSVMTPVW